MQLVSIYPMPHPAEFHLLYDILAQRDENTSISHRRMPSWSDHVEFVMSRPYKDWWVIVVDHVRVGAAYLSKQDEIGVFILKEHQKRGYGPAAVKAVIASQPAGAVLYANINPQNARSIEMFQGLGFRHIQNTYRLEQQ